jgi:Flp pilus assembly protein TadB
LGSHPIAEALHETAPDQTVAPTRSEADMRYITISGHHAGHHTVAAAFWIVAAFWMVAGIVAVTALGGGLTRLAVALAIVITEWWILTGVERRVERNHAEMAPVANLRPSQCDLKEISAHASWRGPVARTAQRSFVAPQHQDLY